MDKARLQRANTRNLSLGQPTFASLEELEKQENSDTQKKDTANDALLTESAEITADFSRLWTGNQTRNAASSAASKP